MNELEEEILKAKKDGLSDEEIGKKYNVNFRFIEKVMTKRLGINVSSPIKKKSIKSLYPQKFSLETTTVWSFKSRGSWATHNGKYRGNWSPYIPRNVILRYSNKGDLVLDCFCGAGTTGVECKLTNRNFIGIDINPNAIKLARENIDFEISGDLLSENITPEINFRVGDARDLSFIEDSSIDLICSHPPYADIIHYTDNHEKDLSFCDVDEFLKEMSKVAKENYRVLKDNGYCAILIGDMRKKKYVVPLGFWLIDVFLKNGFYLKELVIKRQHNCRTTGFWYKNSIKYNFLLLAHEYLAIFKKIPDRDIMNINNLQNINIKTQLFNESISDNYETLEIDKLESTTVWIFNSDEWYGKTIKNLIKRYRGNDYILIDEVEELSKLKEGKYYSLIVFNCLTYNSITKLNDSLEVVLNHINTGGFFAIICNDFRLEDGTIYPSGIAVESNLRSRDDMKIKEIVLISIEKDNFEINSKENLIISHKYLMIYEVSRGD